MPAKKQTEPVDPFGCGHVDVEGVTEWYDPSGDDTDLTPDLVRDVKCKACGLPMTQTKARDNA